MSDEQDREPTHPEPYQAEPAHEAPAGESTETEPQPEPKLERLQKILAQAGLASRRGAEELITQGRVQVNGQVVTELGTRADAARDHIRVDGKLLHGAERLRYFVLNKPKGYVTTVKDPEGRSTVMEFFARMPERLYPIGRLDYQSEGLLLVTNDGELANLLTRASSGVDKTYLIKVSGQPAEEQLEQLRSGVAIDRGKPGEGRVRTAPARIRQIRKGDNPWFEVVLIEGRNRELRKMFEEIGHHVEKIRRVAYGPLVLDVEPGKLRELEAAEVAALRATAEGKFKPRRVKSTRLLPKDAGIPAEERAARAKGRGGKPFRPRGERPRPEQREAPERRPGRKTTYGKDSGSRSGGSARPQRERPPRREPSGSAQAGRGRPASGRYSSDRPSGGKSGGSRPGTGRPAGRPSDAKSGNRTTGGRSKPAFGGRAKPVSGTKSDGSPSKSRFKSGPGGAKPSVRGKSGTRPPARGKGGAKPFTRGKSAARPSGRGKGGTPRGRKKS